MIELVRALEIPSRPSLRNEHGNKVLSYLRKQLSVFFVIDPNVDPIGLAQTGPDQCTLQTNSVEEITSQFGCIWMYLLEKTSTNGSI